MSSNSIIQMVDICYSLISNHNKIFAENYWKENKGNGSSYLAKWPLKYSVEKWKEDKFLQSMDSLGISAPALSSCKNLGELLNFAKPHHFPNRIRLSYPLWRISDRVPSTNYIYGKCASNGTEVLKNHFLQKLIKWLRDSLNTPQKDIIFCNVVSYLPNTDSIIELKTLAS